MKDARDIIKRPIITEKSYQLMEENKYTFEVDRKSNKLEVKFAVQEIFGVNVEKVNIINVKPKKRRVGRYTGLTRNKKKAIVTLAEGQKIADFEM
ncbi:MAG: 50S ribosomal protein L23 [Defluviitaleaceae bacterium]|nr:50S ribosomal protein L23 [Defluviitaleaceae bacterium]